MSATSGASSGHPLPWSAGRRMADEPYQLRVDDGEDDGARVVVWDIDDAEGNRVATVVEPAEPETEREPDRPLPKRRPGGPPVIGNGLGVRESGLRPHWCHDDSDRGGVEFIACVCSTGVDHWSDQMDRPDLRDSGPPRPVTGAPVLLDLANREHERRQRERDHPELRLALDRPAVAVNVPGMTTTIYGGGRSPDRADYNDTGQGPGGARFMPHGTSRLGLAMVRAMLVDALAVVDDQIADMTRVVDRVAPEAVVLAAQRIAAELERSAYEPLPEVADLRIVLRDVADRSPAPEQRT